MKRLFGVFNTDTVNRYGERFTVGALVGSLWDNCEIGNPMLLGHDLRRPIGWARSVALHLEPGLARVVGVSDIAETREETQELSQALEFYLHSTLVEKRKEEIAELRRLVSRHLQGSEQAFGRECVAIVERGLARRMFPGVFAKEDRDGLVPLHELRPIGPGVYQTGKLVVFAHQYFRRSLFRLNTLNAPFLELTRDLSDRSHSIKIALDPDMVGLTSTCRPYGELMYWWGPKFNDDLASIPTGVTVHKASDEEQLLHGIERTEFRWESRKGEHIFEAEELPWLPPSAELPQEHGCRYIHSIVKEMTGEIVHLDAAVRVYSGDQLTSRLKQHIAHAGRHTRYAKLWRMDGRVATATWKSLLCHYFRDNYLVGEYLGASREEAVTPKLTEDASHRSLMQQLVPYSMSAGTGVRVALSFQPRSQMACAKRRLVSHDSLASDGKQTLLIESETVELRKAIDRVGGSVELPHGAVRVSFKDFYTNLPVVVHGGCGLPDSLCESVEAIKRLVYAWREKGLHKVASYAISYPADDNEVRISVLGHVADLARWLSSPLCIPPIRRDKIRQWAEDVSRHLTTKYPTAHDLPPVSETLMLSGLLSIQRRPVKELEVELRLNEELGLGTRIPIPTGKEEFVRDLQAAGISPAPSIVVLESECTKCGRPYATCEHSKLLDDGVAEKITSLDIALHFWTDRPVW